MFDKYSLFTCLSTSTTGEVVYCCVKHTMSGYQISKNSCSSFMAKKYRKGDLICLEDPVQEIRKIRVSI